MHVETVVRLVREYTGTVEVRLDNLIIIKLSEKLCETSSRELAKTLNIDETLVSKIKNDESRMNDETREMLKK